MLGISQLVAASFAGWSALYLLTRHIFQSQSPEWACRAVTILHAALVSLLSVLDWAYLRPWKLQELGQPNTRYEEGVLALTLGYFLFDALWVLRYRTEGPVMYVHHVTSIVCVSYILIAGVSGAEALLSISLLEITNPCLQIRWFLRTHGYQGTPIHTLTEYVFMVSFLLMRIGYGSSLMLQIVRSNRLHVIFKLGTVSLHLVSVVFVYQMFTYIMKKCIGKEKIN